MPITPPISEISIASVRNCRCTSRGPAPTAMRRPISRMRSVTETSMMFMMPMPPTISEIVATAPSSSDISRVVAVRVATISEMLRTLKSSSSPGAILWRWRNSASTSVLHVGQVLGVGHGQRDLHHRARRQAHRTHQAAARGFQRHHDHVVLVLAETALALGLQRRRPR